MRFLGGEGLGGDDEQRGFRVEALERFREVGAVDVGDEMDVEAGFFIGLERFGDHHRAEIRAADADVDDIRDRFAGVAKPCAVAHPLGEFAHVCQHAPYFGHDILAIDQHRFAGAVAQGSVQHGAAFGEVDGFAREHFFCPVGQFYFTGQLQQERQCFRRNEIFRIIEQYFPLHERETGKALIVVMKQIAQMLPREAFLVRLKGLPGRGTGEIGHI